MRAWALCLLAGLMLTGSVRGEVRSRWGSGGPHDLLQQFDWNQAYRSRMQINGGQATVSVYSSGVQMVAALERLHEHYRRLDSATAQFFPGEGMSWGIVLHQRKVVRYLLVEDPHRADTVVYQIHQREADFERSGERPRQHQLEKVPHFPGSQATYYNVDEGTKTALEISRSRASATTIIEQLSSRLESQGWTRSPARLDGMTVFMKGRERVLLGVSVQDGESVITRVHKREVP